ncbi:MAG: hypothetical protein ICV73_15650 [Acetobacteraceae bacterium]|nr:hypothetical protein [Acetobacteraceae bacterium]
MMARVAAWGTGLLATLAVPAVLVLLARLHGAEALLSLPPAEMAVLVMGLFMPPALLLLTVAGLVQRVELVALRNAVLRQATSFDGKSLATEALIEECRNQTALLQEQVRLAISALAVGQRQVETVQHAAAETRMQRLVAEWDMVTVELTATLTAMWRLVHGWRAPGAEGGAELPLPPAGELPLLILRLLPASAQEAARFEVDERFVRQAARYRATFKAFLDRAPETGPLSRATFRDMIYGRVDARLALLPRPNHARVIDPHTLAAE